MFSHTFWRCFFFLNLLLGCQASPEVPSWVNTPPNHSRDELFCLCQGAEGPEVRELKVIFQKKFTQKLLEEIRDGIDSFRSTVGARDGLDKFFQYLESERWQRELAQMVQKHIYVKDTFHHRDERLHCVLLAFRKRSFFFRLYRRLSELLEERGTLSPQEETEVKQLLQQRLQRKEADLRCQAFSLTH